MTVPYVTFLLAFAGNRPIYHVSVRTSGPTVAPSASIVCQAGPEARQ